MYFVFFLCCGITRCYFREIILCRAALRRRSLGFRDVHLLKLVPVNATMNSVEHYDKTKR